MINYRFSCIGKGKFKNVSDKKKNRKCRTEECLVQYTLSWVHGFNIFIFEGKGLVDKKY
jgi:hypothetical protein